MIPAHREANPENFCVPKLLAQVLYTTVDYMWVTEVQQPEAAYIVLWRYMIYDSNSETLFLELVDSFQAIYG